MKQILSRERRKNTTLSLNQDLYFIFKILAQVKSTKMNYSTNILIEDAMLDYIKKHWNEIPEEHRIIELP